MFQMSLFNHILRLAIVVLCLSYSVAALAGGSQNYYSAVKVTITGGGKVYVKPEGSNSETQLTSTGVVAGQRTESWGMGGSDPGSSKNHNYTFRADASGTNYYFSAWKEGNEIKSQNPSYTFTIESTNYRTEQDAKNSPNKEIEAIFNPYVTLPNEIKFVVYSNRMDVASVKMENIYKRTSLTLLLIGTDAGKFKLGKASDNTSEESISFGSDDGLDGTTTKDLIYAYINYSDGEYAPEKALAVSDVKLKVVDNENHTWEIPIMVTEPESYTFLSAVGGKYTVVFANSDKTTIKDITTDQKPTYLRSDMYTLASLTATPNSGYKFFGWQTVDESGVGTYFSYETTVKDKAFDGGTKIRPVFIRKDQAIFVIKEDVNKTPYYDLQEAINVANSTSSYSTVVFNAPTKGTTGTLYPKEDGTAYTIPAGVTLLVPGDAAYTCINSFLEKSHISSTATSEYCRLNIADGTKIHAKGFINLHAGIRQSPNGQPSVFGRMHLGKNVQITTENGAKIFAYGYITGSDYVNDITNVAEDDAPLITISDGAEVYEMLQFTDWRGGTITLGMNNNSQKIFPIKQYYIQNIEVPLTVEYGGFEFVQTALEAMSMQAVPHTKLISHENDVAMFKLHQGAAVTKMYNPKKDRIIYKLVGQQTDEGYSSASIGSVSLTVVIATISSEKYVLPMNNNMDVLFEDIHVTSSNDIELLAGATIKVEENATLELTGNARFFVYDADENVITVNGVPTGYFCSTNSQILPITYTPSVANVKAIRDVDANKDGLKDVEDAKIIVNGTIKINNGTSFYTTQGGAAIVSERAGGRIIENNKTKPSTQTYQANQNGNSSWKEYEISITPAKLRNSDGSYTETSKVYPGTYTYYITDENTKAGVWSLPPATVNPDSWSGTSVTATMPTSPVDMTIQCQVSNVGEDSYANAFTATLSNTTDFAFANNKFSFDANTNTLSIHVKYTPRDNTATAAETTLTLKNATVPTPEYTYTTRLIATEEYIPEFEVSETTIQLPTVTLNSTSKVDNFTITPAANNVAGLNNDSRLKWTYELSDSDFGYEQGTLNSGVITGNTITFTSSEAGTQHATLTITATYTPENGGDSQSYSQEVTLTGTTEINNTLQYDMPDQIWVTDKNVAVQFTGQNNTSAITVTLTDADAAELVKKADGTYAINALNAGEFTLIASQDASGGVASITNLTHTITVAKLTPNPIWNWGVVYGNQEYTLPFDISSIGDGLWTLTKAQDEDNLLEYNVDNKTLRVHSINTQSSASFLFNQEETHDYIAAIDIPFSTTINRDPRILPTTITNDAEFAIIKYDMSEGVESQLGYINIPAGGYVVLQFVGMPGAVTFASTNDVSALILSESVDAKSWKSLGKVEDKNEWTFSAYSPSQYVKIENTGKSAVSINSGLTISLYGEDSQRAFYYAKVSAVAEPQNAGVVAARGGTSSQDPDLLAIFSPEQPQYLPSTNGYYQYLAGMETYNVSMSFFMYAKSNAGYYFDNWSPVGHSMATTNSTTYTEMRLEIDNVEDMYLGYGYDMYKSVYKNLYPENFDSETGDLLVSSDMMNAGTLALIPATHVGTWQANFALAEVVSVEDVAWESTSPNVNDVVKGNVIFNVKGDNVDDFEASISGDGFSFSPTDITISASHNTYTINTSYTPQDIHGAHTATLTLSRIAIKGVTETSTKTATLTVTENLTPSFTLTDTEFGSGTLGQETVIDIVPADKNKVAQVSDPAKLKWEAALNENAPFEILSVSEDGTCKVRYFRTESGAKSADLTISATYTDSKGEEIPFATTCTLTGSSTADKAKNTLKLVQDIVLYVDNEPISPFSVNDKNNTAPITFTLPEGCTSLVVEDGMIKPSGDFSTGTFTITATQEANAYFQASGSLTTTVTVKKHTPEVTWNWKDLYFGQTYTKPVETNSNGDVTIAVLDDKNIVQYDAETKTLTTDPTLTEGEFNVNFLVSIEESKTYEAYSKTHTATLYKDPRHVRVDVNEALTYRSVTIADKTGENVSFADGGIHFEDVVGSEYTSRSWTMYFIGVPDQLYFTPEGNNAWEIEESPDGTNWSLPTFASSQLPAGEAFSMSLRPSTRYLRISYAKTADDIVERSNGVLNSFYITALQGVKANVDGLYMPIAANVVNTPTTKQVVLQYTSQEKLTISTSDPQFTVDVAELPALNVDKYTEQKVTITSKATEEKEGRIYVKNAAGDILLELPIYTFIFPQTLPIQLATDEPQRFYYVTTASNYAKWDMNTRVVTLQNAPANETRSLTFAFDGAPTLLRYNHTAGDRGRWIIRESANNADWYEADPTTRVVSGNEIEQGLRNTTCYVQLQYESPYSEKVEVSNLIIVGDASVTTDVTVLKFTEQEKAKTLTITAFNLSDFNVSVDNDNFVIGEVNKSGLGASVADVLVPITWNATKAVEYATLTITNPNDNDAVLATIELVGTKQSISDPTNIGIYTGLAKDITINGTFEGTESRPVDLSNAFDETTHTKALFDYLFIYGETSTMDGSATIVTPNSQHGSNAKTPCYIYKRDGDSYSLYKVVDNVNSEDKAWPGYIPVEPNGISTRVYITGFAPYASTGYTKEEEGVWCFRGQAGSKLDVYLEDSYIYSRYKTIDGHSFIDRDNGESFAEQYARGSGGVLVFECSSVGNKDNPFKVNIHTMDRNLLKSHYGCFLSSIVGRAFQVSSPIQVHLISTDITAATHLSFDDIWPTAITRTTTDGVVTAEEVSTKRTNGFISLQKQVNNAPSIDLGSPETVVNFNGGQVELQNAQNVSDNYKTTLAISYRGGKFAGYFLAHGVGSDEVTGTVNFNDGTTTVIPMTVDERYRQYYLMDEDEHGNELNITSCLRCPQNTYVYGGSHCMMRACNEPTSKGGAPWSHAGEGAVRLGMYKYPYASYTTGEGEDAVTHAGGWTVIEGANGLVSIPVDYIPNIKVGDQVARQYGVASVMPNDNGTPDIAEDDYLNFWVPAGYDDSVTPEVDLKVSYWKAAMTKIKAEYASYGGEVGGNIQIGDDTEVETELVYNLLYCVLDNDIRQVISAKEIIDGKEVYKYAAPVKHPAAAGYLEVRPSEVGTDPANYVENQNPYEVQNRVYYITPIASADNWMTFTAPFDVENIYVVETYDEKVLATQGSKAEIKIKQAEHNADFAAFFGVALALGSDRDFEDIYANYIGWAKLQDVGKYTGQYNLRGKHELEYYDGTNWSTANYYLYENQGTWTINADGVFTTQWTLPDVSDEILMNKGETYSLLFPYCTGCWEYDEDGNFIERTMWDYWSGKFVIFESTLRSEENPHVIDGVNTAQAYVETHTPAPSEAYVLGNTSFGDLRITNEHLYQYVSKDPLYEEFKPVGNVSTAIQPTSSFLLANITAPAGQKITGIRRTGEIIYDKHGTSDVGHIPTVGGGHDLFITSIEGGINVAVAAPQYVRVLSSTGSVIYSGMIQTALDIQLPSLGMYVVSGEKEVQKVMY